jgi:Autotransporter beta-domain
MASALAAESPHLGGRVESNGRDSTASKQGKPAMRHAGAAFVAMLIAPFPGAAAELCPALSSTTSIPCESLIDPASDLLQARVTSRLNIGGATPDDGASVWAETRQTPFQTIDGAPALTTTYFGADYRLGSDLLIGAMVQRDDRIVTLPIGVELTATDAYLAGPYAAFRLSSNLVLGARASWGKTSDGTTLASEEAEFTTNRLLTEARLSGNWGFGEWQLMPTAAVTHVDETAIAAIPSLAGTSVTMNRVTAGPEVRRSIDMGFGSSLEPFAFFKASFDLDDIKVGPGAAHSTIGGGVVVNDAEGYVIQAMGDYSETVGAAIPDQSLAGRVLVSVPLN